jgi:4-amino-4-deoxy-L-arabinose transferase-like glycosyltransferase
VNRFLALGILVALWAAIYLPGLGIPELKGEEGRRILPAATMLEAGNPFESCESLRSWIVPYLGGAPYLRKPPLINWLIALSFKISDTRNEWAARLPSVLSMLALGVAIIGIGGAWIGNERALAAAILTLTNIGAIEKGRLAEIEAVYVALTGIAIVGWLSWWATNRSPWLTWVAPFFFLGLALLTKGPLHLLFFYAIVVAVCWRAKRMKDLASVPHFAGVALMLGIFALWAVPYFRMTAELNAAHVWVDQFAGRVKSFDLQGWLLNIPRGLANYLPWLLLAPLLYRPRKKVSPVDTVVFEGTRFALFICFFGLLILPAALPRYTLPLITPASLLIGCSMFDADELRWNILAQPLKLVICGAILIALCVLAFALFALPRMRSHERLRPFASLVDEKVPADEPLYVVDAGYQPVLFYFHRRLLYADSMKRLPDSAHYVFTPAETLTKKKMHGKWETLGELSDGDRRKSILLRGSIHEAKAPGK